MLSVKCYPATECTALQDNLKSEIFWCEKSLEWSELPPLDCNMIENFQYCENSIVLSVYKWISAYWCANRLSLNYSQTICEEINTIYVYFSFYNFEAVEFSIKQLLKLKRLHLKTKCLVSEIIFICTWLSIETLEICIEIAWYLCASLFWIWRQVEEVCSCVPGCRQGLFLFEQLSKKFVEFGIFKLVLNWKEFECLLKITQLKILKNREYVLKETSSCTLVLVASWLLCNYFKITP